MGNALLIQFPQLRFDRRLIPFISTEEEARRVVEALDRAVTAAADTEPPRSPSRPWSVRRSARSSDHDVPDDRLLRQRSPDGRVGPGRAAAGIVGRLHGPGTCSATPPGWRPSSTRSSTTTGRACGRWTRRRSSSSRRRRAEDAHHDVPGPGSTVVVANYPLVEEDLETTDLPRPIARPAGPGDRAGGHAGAAVGGASAASPNGGTPRSKQCTDRYLRRAEATYAANRASGDQLDDQVGRGDVDPHPPDVARAEKMSGLRRDTVTT